jgi:hypothetical protein
MASPISTSFPHDDEVQLTPSTSTRHYDLAASARATNWRDHMTTEGIFRVILTRRLSRPVSRGLQHGLGRAGIEAPRSSILLWPIAGLDQGGTEVIRR